MCGRAAQTHHSLAAAAGLLLRGEISRNESHDTWNSGSDDNRNSSDDNNNNNNNSSDYNIFDDTNESNQNIRLWRENYNLSPGMDCMVFWNDQDRHDIRVDRKVWGLVTKKGTANAPLPTGMSQHFANLMFNARADTLLEKRTFRALLEQKRTCLIIVDGFFEWKPPALKGSKKQPYYVYRRNTYANDATPQQHEDRPYLVFAGLWTSVPTGRPQDPTLDTFTIITTDACPSLRWLHHRMPLCVWDDTMAKDWLERPTPKLFQMLDEAATQTPSQLLDWHAVTPLMNSTSYRSAESIEPLPPPVSVKSFFGTKSASTKPTTSSNSAKLVKDPPQPKSELPPSLPASSLENLLPVVSSMEKQSIAPKSPPARKRSLPPDTTSTKASPSKRRGKVAATAKGSIASFFSPKTK